MRKPIFLVYSDIHHHNYTSFNEENRRILIPMNFEMLVFLNAKKLGVDVLFSGDIIHNDQFISNHLLSFILPHYKDLGRFGVKWVGISGNHDQCSSNTSERQSINYVQTFSNTFDYMNCIDFKGYENDKAMIHGIPYTTNDINLYEDIKNIRLNKKKPNILMLHTTLPTTRDTDGRLIQTNTIGKKVMRILEKKFDLVLTGHIHKPMKISKKIIQVGATNQQRKTDRECSLGYWIIYDNMTVKFIEVNNPGFVELPYGKKPKDKDNFYYNKQKDVEVKQDEKEENSFSDTKPRSLAKAYLKEKGIKDINKKRILIRLLKN